MVDMLQSSQILEVWEFHLQQHQVGSIYADNIPYVDRTIAGQRSESSAVLADIEVKKCLIMPGIFDVLQTPR